MIIFINMIHRSTKIPWGETFETYTGGNLGDTITVIIKQVGVSAVVSASKVLQNAPQGSIDESFSR